MNWIDGFFFFYMFVGLYLLSLLLFVYFQNRKKMYEYPKGTPVPVSIVVPCFNEGNKIGGTIESLLNLNYPKEMIEIIVVDDKSTDNSVSVIKRYVKKNKNIRLLVNEKNSGGAAYPLNRGIKAAKYDVIAVADADSTPERDALIKMIGFLQAEKDVAAVTCAVLVKEPKTFIQKMQAIEYASIAFSRKLLDFLDSVYVTPGPFAIYKKSALFEAGLFDTKNLTQDIEIVWNLISKGYKARMCLSAVVFSSSPPTIKKWFKQRIRWNIGGTQTILKYRKLFFKRGMLGYFIIPFFTFSLILGLMGLSLFTYLFIIRTISFYLVTKYSVYADTSILRFQEFSFLPSVLNYFGFVLFALGLWFTFFTLSGIKKTGKFDSQNIFNVLIYSLIYLTVYPITLITALYKMIRGRYTW